MVIEIVKGLLAVEEIIGVGDNVVSLEVLTFELLLRVRMRGSRWSVVLGLGLGKWFCRSGRGAGPGGRIVWHREEGHGVFRESSA